MGFSKSGPEENTFIKAYEDMEKSSKTPLRGPEAYPLVEIVHGPKQGAWFTIAYQKEITLGRAGSNSIVLEDNSVSRSHAVLQLNGDQYTIRDIGSRNGSFLNGKKIQGEIPLQHMDIIKIGIYTLRFLQEPTDQVYEMEVKDEHTPQIAQEEPQATVEKETASPEIPAEQAIEQESFTQEKKSDENISKDIQAISSEQAVSAPVKNSRVLRNSLILLILIGLIGGGGYLAYYFGVFDKVKTSLGNKTTTSNSKNKPSTPKVTKPEPVKPSPVELGQVIPVFLEADAQPIPAKVFYKEKELGTTPFRISVQIPSGKSEELSAEFPLEALGQTWVEKASIQVTKQDEVVPLKFTAQWGYLKINALPKNAQLFIEGKFQRDSTELKPTKLEGLAMGQPIYLPFGHYIAQLQVSENLADSNSQVNAIKYRREFDLNENSPVFEIAASDEDLKSFPAEIHSEPAGAELWVDGKKYGTTPFQGELPTGKHKLVLKKEGFNDFEKEITVELNTPYSATYNLATTAAGEYINKGRSLIRKGLYNEGIEQLAEALKRNPEATEVSEIHLLLGNAFLKTKTYDQAIAYLQKAKENPENVTAADLGLAEAYSGIGQNDQALNILINIVLNTKDEKVRSQAESVYHRIYPMRSVLYVVSDPPGAQVLINGNTIAQPTPVILSDLLVGTYRVGLQKDGFKPYESRVTLSLSVIKPLIVKLEAQAE